MFDQPNDEFRWASASFPFSHIRPEQRVWLTMWESDTVQNDNPYPDRSGAYLALGTRHGRAGARDEPRKGWLIPWWYWRTRVEEPIGALGQVSLPLVAANAKLIDMRQYGADTLLKPYQLTWLAGGWHLEEDHPLYNLEQITDVFKERWTELEIEYGVERS